MKEYEVTVKMIFKKEMKVRANSGNEAMDKAKDIVTNTDLVEFGDDELDEISIEAERYEHNTCDDCDEDCEFRDDDDEREFLFEELY